MTKEEGNKIKEAIARTSIPEEMSALYLFANATDMMLHNTFRRIKNIYRTHGYEIKGNDLLTGLHRYCEMVQQAVTQFQARVEPQIIGATFGKQEKGSVAGYDGFQDDCRELCHLGLLYIDRTARNNENSDKVFRTLNEMEGCGMFGKEDMDKYKRR